MQTSSERHSQEKPFELPFQERIRVISSLMENHFFDLSKFPGLAGGSLFPQFWAFQNGVNSYSAVLALYLQELETFPLQMKAPEFWRFQPEDRDQIRYSAAVNFYLNRYLGRAEATAFENCLRMLARNCYEWKDDPKIGRDFLLLFLHQNLRYLKCLYVLYQPHNLNVDATAEALQSCFDAPENHAFMVGLKLSQWVLDEWLPLHLRHCYHKDKPDREETKRGKVQDGLFEHRDRHARCIDSTVLV